MEKSKNDIINLDDQLTKAKGEVEDFKGKLASTKEDMTRSLGDISVNIAKAESEMSLIKAESEGYSNRIDDLDHRIKGRIDKLNVRTENEERFTTYAKEVLPGLVGSLQTIKDSGTYNIIIVVISMFIYNLEWSFFKYYRFAIIDIKVLHLVDIQISFTFHIL